MPKLPILSGQQIIKALNKIGYRVIRQKSLLMKMLRNAELTPEEFLELLE